MSSASPEDRETIHRLAERVAEIAVDPINCERRESWRAMHDLKPVRPMVLAEHGGIRDPLKPFTPELVCGDPTARGIEGALRLKIWLFEELRDDHVIEPNMNVGWAVQGTGYGVDKEIHEVHDEGILNAKSWDAPITDIARDIHLLKPRTFSVNRQATYDRRDALAELIGDVLDVRIRGSHWWSMGLTLRAIDFIGLTNLMLFMYDDPEGLHRIMAFLRDDHLAHAAWLEAEGLLTLNHEDDYVGSGSCGYVSDLPGGDWLPGQPVGQRHQWVLLESQETVGVGPEQFEEFIFPYQKAIGEMFGLVYYGCCEPVNTRWDVVRQMPHLRSVSVAPLCDQETMGACLGKDYVYSRKPNPTLISTGRFDEAEIRRDLRATLDVTAQHGCATEIIMKDVHTINNDPARLARWVQLAREEAGQV